MWYSGNCSKAVKYRWGTVCLHDTVNLHDHSSILTVANLLSESLNYPSQYLAHPIPTDSNAGCSDSDRFRFRFFFQSYARWFLSESDICQITQI